MVPDEETKRMLPAAQPVPMSDLEMNETSSALGSNQDDPPPYEDNKLKPDIPTVYEKAKYPYGALRCSLAIAMLAAAAWIMARGTQPTTSWIAFPWAAYCLACSIMHLLLILHHAVPRGGSGRRRALPGRAYMTALLSSPLLLLVALAGGAVVLHFTQAHFDERDRTNGMTARCGKRRRRCYPKTLEGAVFDVSCALLAFVCAELLCGLKLCYDMFSLSRHFYTEEEVRIASDIVSKTTYSTIVKSW